MRATGSGAGCGAHWPKCNGDVVPFSGTTETAIEFAHRASSGVAFLAVLGLLVAARRRFGADDPVRRAARWAAGFMVGEVLIGALLVTYEWVGDDASVMRAIVDGLHLVNTLFLLGALTILAWSASNLGGASGETDGRERRLVAAGIGALLLVAAAGALTALGDTLFPPESVGAGLGSDLAPGNEFLVRMRVVHPVLAVAAGLYLISVGRRLIGHSDRRVRDLAQVMAGLVVIQLVAGAVNVALLAPVWMQVVHLLLADVLFIGVVMLALALRPVIPSSISAATTGAAAP